MPVFISHRSSDNATAKQVHDLLTQLGIKCYIDELDEGLRQTDDITAVIVTRLSQCSHLLAVVSRNTSGSWWVPFEIGVGTASDTRISSYKVAPVDLPQYLSKWPILSSTTDLIKFAQLYGVDKRILLEKGMQAEARNAVVQTAGDFHSQLKRALGQR
jgi:hypothetical protein